MILTYKSSNGTVWDLKGKLTRARTFNAHTHTWNPQAISAAIGERVYGFQKEPQVYDMQLAIMGGLDERRRHLNQLHEAFDADIFSMTPGRITHGMLHIDCYITYTETFAEGSRTENTIQIYCPYPMWEAEHKYSFEPGRAHEYEYLDYEYDYSYDYGAELLGFGAVKNPGAGPANYELVIYGPVTDPVIVLDNRKIGIVGSLGAGEKCVIKSRDKTVVKYRPNGQEINMFNARLKEESIFDKLAPGTHTLIWTGHFAFDLTVIEERSEPPWI